MTELAWVIGVLGAIFFLFRFPKQVGVLVASLLVIAVAVWAFFFIQSEATRRDLANIEVQASGTSDLCNDPAYPVWVSFINRTGKTVEYISFSLRANQPQHSGFVYTNYQTSDRIIPPTEGFGNCWSLSSYGKPSQAPAELEWSVELYSARYR